MEELNKKLYKLLNDEIDNLDLGHSYDKSRMEQMLSICKLIKYIYYVELSAEDIIKLSNLYSY